MAKLSAAAKSRAKSNAKARGNKKAGAYDNLRAAGKPMKQTKGKRK